MIPSYRYVDGALVPCPDYGPVARFCEPKPAAPFVFVPWQRAQKLGICGLDLRRERQRTGVPEWYKPNASRRGRIAAWSRVSRETRQRWLMSDPTQTEQVKTVALYGHRFQDGDGNGAMLYLPEDEQPSERHGRDLDRMLREKR